MAIKALFLNCTLKKSPDMQISFLQIGLQDYGTIGPYLQVIGQIVHILCISTSQRIPYPYKLKEAYGGKEGKRLKLS